MKTVNSKICSTQYYLKHGRNMSVNGLISGVIAPKWHVFFSFEILLNDGEKIAMAEIISKMWSSNR